MKLLNKVDSHHALVQLKRPPELEIEYVSYQQFKDINIIFLDVSNNQMEGLFEKDGGKKILTLVACPDSTRR